MPAPFPEPVEPWYYSNAVEAWAAMSKASYCRLNNFGGAASQPKDQVRIGFITTLSRMN